MKIVIYYDILGSHVHMRVFVNSGNAGQLIVRDTEFEEFKSKLPNITFERVRF